MLRRLSFGMRAGGVRQTDRLQLCLNSGVQLRRAQGAKVACTRHVMTDALNIHEGILKLKKAVLQRRAA